MFEEMTIHTRAGCHAGRARKENGIERQIVDSEFSVVYADDYCCTVVGWMRAKTPETSGMILAAMQRATFQYALFDGVTRAVHIHVSNSWDAVEENEVFPFREGRETYQYVQSVLHRQNKVLQKKIVRDIHYRTHFLIVDEMQYVQVRNMVTGQVIGAEKQVIHKQSIEEGI